MQRQLTSSEVYAQRRHVARWIRKLLKTWRQHGEAQRQLASSEVPARQQHVAPKVRREVDGLTKASSRVPRQQQHEPPTDYKVVTKVDSVLQKPLVKANLIIYQLPPLARKKAQRRLYRGYSIDYRIVRLGPLSITDPFSSR